jgi:hypothetical protein
MPRNNWFYLSMNSPRCFRNHVSHVLFGEQTAPEHLGKKEDLVTWSVSIAHPRNHSINSHHVLNASIYSNFNFWHLR